MKEENIYQRLLKVQKELKAPRDVKGQFGNARSAEQILEQAKPVCYNHGLYLYTSDTVERVGERNYITATATVINVDKPEESHSADASAWEGQIELSKYGNPILDTSQISGKTSSYAKKYALQNLFAIDDTKDADQDEEKVIEVDKPKVSSLYVNRLMNLAKEADIAPEKMEKRIEGLQNDDEAKDAIKVMEALAKPISQEVVPFED